jgi:hypothetical protein
LAEIDFTQTHSYGKADLRDHAPAIHREAMAHRVYGKPHWMAEFGIDWRSPDSKYDLQGRGVNLHNAMWAAVMSGDGGGALIWWWDSYVHPQRLYPQFTALRKFIDQVPWAAGEWQPVRLEVQPAKAVNAYGITCDRTVLLWLQNEAHTWQNVFEKRESAPVRELQLSATGLPDGKYSLEWWNTSTGAVERHEETEVKSGTLRLIVSELKEDVAVQLRRL